MRPYRFSNSAYDPADFVQKMKIEVPTKSLPGPWDTWVYHIVDTVFMRAWLKHPYFHMIK